MIFCRYRDNSGRWHLALLHVWKRCRTYYCEPGRKICVRCGTRRETGW